MKLLRVTLNGEEHPNYTLTKTFEKHFDCKTIWWQQYPKEVVNQLIIDEVRNNKYDAVFLQVQTPNIINEETAKAISENSIGFNWTGDVRTNIDWYAELGKHWVTLFTNETDVDKMRELGLRSDYLQIGYDDKFYYPLERECHNNIVFCANYYPENDYPLTDYRRAVVEALKKEFGSVFNLYGGNWQKCAINSELYNVNNKQEAEIYRTAAIAINCSHFNYSRYSSDRLLREMACGSFVLTHDFVDYDKDYTDNVHLKVWQDIPDLITKCHYYLRNPYERKMIAKQGCDLVTKNATWDCRMKEFLTLINKYKK